jgi:hypothetical protein
MTKININDLTLGEIKELASLLGNKFLDQSNDSISPFQIGKNYFIRTVTMTHVGKLEAVNADNFVLSSASWVADSGRLSDAMMSGLESLDSSELEPFVNDIIIGRGALIDMTVYNFPLPTKQK